MYGVPLSRGIDLSHAKALNTVLIDSAGDIDVSKLIFPTSLPNVLILHSEPQNLTELALPPTAVAVAFDESRLSSLEGMALPDSTMIFSVFGCNLTSIRGVKWPKSLEILLLAGNDIEDFEIRQSDTALFQKLNLTDATIRQSSCRDPQAKTLDTLGVTLCVISDERFAELYGRRLPPSSSSSSSKSASDASDQEVDRGSSSANPTQIVDNTADATEDSQATSSLLIFVIACGIVIVFIGAGFAYRFYAAGKRGKPTREDEPSDYGPFTDKYHTPPTDSVSGSARSTEFSLTPDHLTSIILNDPVLVAHRLDQLDLLLISQVARGGHGAIYKAAYRGRQVAVKYMLPDTWRDDKVLASFMAEIRMCAQLDHPQIVSFVGISWDSLSDLSVVTEFMSGGDLHALLSKQPTPCDAQDWSDSWTLARIKSKASIARDVAAALVYLHAFPRPILHRDLKACNVLLDTESNAKLTDFGISRMLAADDTMTCGIGTVAWTAPEVLRGKRYSERADVYSFGVLLVELDRCRHPYTEHPQLDTSERGGSGASFKNTQIAVSVSTGKLRPLPSPQCPPTIQKLIAWCVEFDAAKRPTASELLHELHHLRWHKEEEKEEEVEDVVYF